MSPGVDEECVKLQHNKQHCVVNEPYLPNLIDSCYNKITFWAGNKKIAIKKKRENSH